MDLSTTVGQEILSPISGKVRNFTGEKTKYPMLQIYPSTPNGSYDYIEIIYVKAPPNVAQGNFRTISAGEPIGLAVSLQVLKYPEGVTPHIHIQMFKNVNGKNKPVDPTPFFLDK